MGPWLKFLSSCDDCLAKYCTWVLHTCKAHHQLDNLMIPSFPRKKDHTQEGALNLSQDWGKETQANRYTRKHMRNPEKINIY